MYKLIPLFLAIPILASSCSEFSTARTNPAYVAFTSREDYQKTSEVYRDDSLLRKAASVDTVVRVDLSDQRAQLLVGEQVALDTPVCTGKYGKCTPVGTFPIKEKIQNKRSNIFGALYRKGRQVFRGDRRKYHGRYDYYVGSSLPFWMRLTDSGVGLHASKYVHRYPKSNGCVRMPHEAVSTIYSVVDEGTPVKVEH